MLDSNQRPRAWKACKQCSNAKPVHQKLEAGLGVEPRLAAYEATVFPCIRYQYADAKSNRKFVLNKPAILLSESLKATPCGDKPGFEAGSFHS